MHGAGAAQVWHSRLAAGLAVLCCAALYCAGCGSDAGRSPSGADAAAPAATDSSTIDAPTDTATDSATYADAFSDAAYVDSAGPTVCAPGWLAAASAVGEQCVPDLPIWGALALSPAAPVTGVSGDGSWLAPDSGREWLVRPDPASMGWQSALAACAQEQAGGHGDWHLPSLAELQTVLDYMRSEPASTLPLAAAAWYWSATPAADPSKAWGVAMGSGLAGEVPVATEGIALCVRATDGAGPPPQGPRFQASADELVVHDQLTGLTWQRQGDASGLQPFDYAQVYCKQLPLSGGGWRTPTVVELASLVDRHVQQPALDAAALPGTQLAPYWTSTPFAGVALYAWYVEFASGSVRFDGDRTYTYAWVRCVR